VNLRHVIAGAIATVTAASGGLAVKYADPEIPERTGVCAADTAARMGFVREEGDNEGAWVETFQRSTNTPPGSAWCGSFVYWSMAQCGRVPPGPASKYAWVPSWADPARKVRSGDARPGDVYLLYFASKGRFAHMGIVVSVNADGSLIVAEGNTNYLGSRDGSGCHLRVRVPGPMDGLYRW